MAVAAAKVARCSAGANVAERAPRRCVRSAARCVGGMRTALLHRAVTPTRSKARDGKREQVVVRADRNEEARQQREEYSRKMNDMVKAEQRWQRNLREGLVLSVSAEDGEEMVVSGEYQLLDVRQDDEFYAAHVDPSMHVPLFIENTSDEWKDKLKRFGDYTFGGGWWTGAKTMTANKAFPTAVREKIPEEDKPILVVCQTGKNSIMACDLLRNMGYGKVAWINGGFNAILPGQFERGSMTVKGDLENLQLASVSGVSGALGYTKEQAAQRGGRLQGYIRVAALLVFVDVAAYYLLKAFE